MSATGGRRVLRKGRLGAVGDERWWRTAGVYQIYPRSFADANGDGVGDLNGIRSRIWYLTSLGVDAIWLSPFYPSALADGGYDVDDYRAVDPTLGSLRDFDAMTAALHAADIRVMIDIVPNHTSNRHAWVREALAAEGALPARVIACVGETGQERGAGETEAVLTRQGEVEDQDVALDLLKPSQGLGDTRGGAGHHDVGVVTEAQGQSVHEHLVVVHEQYP